MKHTEYVERLKALKARYDAGRMSHPTYLKAIIALGERYRRFNRRSLEGDANDERS